MRRGVEGVKEVEEDRAATARERLLKSREWRKTGKKRESRKSRKSRKGEEKAKGGLILKDFLALFRNF